MARSTSRHQPSKQQCSAAQRCLTAQTHSSLHPHGGRRIKYYNNSLFHNVQSNFIAQTGAPAGETSGGSSVYG